MSETENTEIKILNAARKVFTGKGFAAARMEDIATEAGINRALLHYYFRSKAKMFELIYEEKFKTFFNSVSENLLSDDEIKVKIKNLVLFYNIELLENPDIPLFIVTEVNNSPENFMKLATKFKYHPKEAFSKFHQQVIDEIKLGKIREIQPFILLLNILSLSIFPFISRKLFMTISGIDDNSFRNMILSRVDQVTNMILNDLKTN